MDTSIFKTLVYFTLFFLNLRESSASSGVTYKEVLKNLKLTLPGTFTTKSAFNTLACASFCLEIQCQGFGYIQPTKVCRLYTGLNQYLVPEATTVYGLRTFLPLNSNIIFIKVLTPARPWNVGKADCEALNGKLIYIPIENDAEGIRLLNLYGGYMVGLYKTSRYSKTFYDFYGNTFNESEIKWIPGQPDYIEGINLSPFCISRTAISGHEDVWCESDFGDFPICDVYGDWRYS
ncbi:uncharacterized protein LOC135216250 [Macrobrachium nipponense]|uniref:uncharacterized protein LOC135216250 n=1 Tax=Macrobrachium nipponense TaxID=159736 RepID=UPI0030C85767